MSTEIKGHMLHKVRESTGHSRGLAATWSIPYSAPGIGYGGTRQWQEPGQGKDTPKLRRRLRSAQPAAWWDNDSCLSHPGPPCSTRKVSLKAAGLRDAGVPLHFYFLLHLLVGMCGIFALESRGHLPPPAASSENEVSSFS